MMKSNNFGIVNVVENDRYQYGVTDNNGNVIVPFGKYGWISGYDHGLARVKSLIRGVRIDLAAGTFEYPKWGIIDMEGNEVLPVEYDEIWNFLGKGRENTKVLKDGNVYWFDLGSHELIGHAVRSVPYDWDDPEPNYGYGTSYGKYAGSYAQDVMGYSDDVIDDVFEGDPDAYWNID